MERSRDAAVDNASGASGPRQHRYRLVNVFAEEPLSGNALCVFEDGRPLSDAEMQALALQLNLSETTFILPSDRATARVRIFTPGFEMPFAGHPTLGTAHVVRSLHGAGDAITLDMKAGVIPVSAVGDVWTLQAVAPQEQPLGATRGDVARMLGIAEADVAPGASWVHTGSEQLIVPLTSPEAVAACRPDPAMLRAHGAIPGREGLAYVWSRGGAGEIVARFFFLRHGTLVEDPGTGSACANLGGWLLLRGATLPISLTIHQGAATGRPCRLMLHVDAERRIFVTGRVVSIGSGVITL
jgi:trans-2,3-dihydro-3-hydroxyanthranilate isomerase